MLRTSNVLLLWIVGDTLAQRPHPSDASNEAWVAPRGLPEGSNGGTLERLTRPAAGEQPHIVFILWDDYGWAEAGWHRNYTIAGLEVRGTAEVQTPALDELVASGIELDRAYAYKCCSPTRSAIQSGRHPYHVNALNAAMEISNPEDPVSGFAGIPRNMTGIATKLAAAGYSTAMFGKWDAGMATPDHTPRGRGYQKNLFYFHHDNDYWSMAYDINCNGTIVTDLWRTPAPNGGEGPAFGFNSTCVAHQPAGARVPANGCDGGPRGDHWFGGYEDSLFEQHVIQTIREHDATTPLFLFWAPHIVHWPGQVPQAYLDKFAFIAPTDQVGAKRQTYHSMVRFADDAVANATAELKAKRMFDDTLIVFSGDNGGWVSKNGTAGGNNYPLAGGKYNNWEGGIRMNSFVSGGFIPLTQRGTKYSGLVAAWDWYATFAELAGVDATDHRAALAQLPPIDSISMVPVLLGQVGLEGDGRRSNVEALVGRPRLSLALGAEPRLSNLSTAPPCSSLSQPQVYDESLVGSGMGLPSPRQGNCSSVIGLIVDEGADGLWKLITGDENQYVWTGPHYPNSSTDFDSQAPEFTKHCGASPSGGCLFNLLEDPFERKDVAWAFPDKVRRMISQIEALELTAFNPHRGSTDPRACETALARGNFWGPWLD